MVLGLPRHGSAALCVVRGGSWSGISPCFARLVNLGGKWSIGAHLIRSLRGAQCRSRLGLHRSPGERVRRRRLGLEVDEGWCREVTDVLLRRLGRVLRHLLLDPDVVLASKEALGLLRERFVRASRNDNLLLLLCFLYLISLDCHLLLLPKLFRALVI